MPKEDQSAQTAELLRLTLAKLGQLKIPVNAINYSLFFLYFSGQDEEFNQHIDAHLSKSQSWTEELAESLFKNFVCDCPDDEKNGQLSQELLSTVANILGMLVDMAGKAALSNTSLEKHIKELATTNEPKRVLNIASEIISETRHFMEETEKFEETIASTSQEIAALKNELVNVRKQASIDPLTGLHNRRAFNEALQQCIEENLNEENQFCMLLIDIDHFKKINDTHGHLVGDKVLAGIANVMTKKMRGGDYSSRFGGEEFSILLQNTMITGAFTVAENLRKVIESLKLKHIKSGEYIGQVTVSIGVSCYRKGESDQEFIDRCDKALYRAKSLGRNRTVIAD